MTHHRLPGTVNCAECGHLNNYHRQGMDRRDGLQDGSCKDLGCECKRFFCPHPTELSWLVRGVSRGLRNVVGVTCLCGAGMFRLPRDGEAWEEIGTGYVVGGMRIVGGGQRVAWTAAAQQWFDRVQRERPKVHCRDWRPGDPEDLYHPPRCLEPPAPKERPVPKPLVEPAPASYEPLSPDEVAALDAMELRAFRDPLLRGELLAFVLLVIRARRSRIAIPDTRTMAVLAALWLGWDHRPLSDGPWQLKHIIGQDVPGYVPDQLRFGAAGPCEAGMIRRAGLCGQPGSDSLTVAEYSPVDGTVRYHYFCNRHKIESRACEAVVTRREDAPRPRPNRGGALMRHLPDWDWKALYKWASPTWEPPKELFVDDEALERLGSRLFGDGEEGLD